jgi:AcrR family transcriptional regulator
MAGVIAERENVIPLIGEVFRTYGFAGASLARISEGTKLGKGSIYHFFPGGKEEMAEAVLAQVDMWFKQHVFEPLVERADAIEGIKAMFDDVNSFTFSGRRVCLAGVLRSATGVTASPARSAITFRPGLMRLQSLWSELAVARKMPKL